MPNILRILIALALLSCVTSCTKMVRPAINIVQDYLGAYHVELHAGAPGAAIVSSRAIALTGSAAAGFKITAPLIDGVRGTILERGVGVGEFGAWVIRLAEDDGTWIEVERVECAAVREHLPEVKCPDDSGALRQTREPDLVRKQIRL